MLLEENLDYIEVNGKISLKYFFFPFRGLNELGLSRSGFSQRLMQAHRAARLATVVAAAPQLCTDEPPFAIQNSKQHFA